MKIYQVLNNARKQLYKITKDRYSAYKEAEEILIHILKITRETLYVMLKQEIPEKIRIIYENSIKKRLKGEPLQYILESEYFYGREFIVKKGVFIPRPDTETIIDAVKALGKDIKKSITIADCGCGTGVIAITLLKEVKNIKMAYCYDINKKAIELTELNAKKHNVYNRIKLIYGDFFKKAQEQNKKFDIIVSNPPYIRQDEIDNLQKEVKKEPKTALVAGIEGISFYKKFIKYCNSILKKNGYLIFELGDNMAETVKKLFENKKWTFVMSMSDFRKKVRVLVYKIN